MSIRRTFGNSFLYGIAPQVPQIANMFVLPFITPFLTKADYGIHGIITAYIAGFSILETLGLRMVFVNAFFHYQKQYKWAWRQLAAFQWLWSIIYYSILGLFLWFNLPEEIGLEQRKIIIAIACAPLLYGPFSQMSQTILQLKERALPVALRALLIGLVGVACNFIFIGIYKQGFMGWYYTLFITTILTHLCYFPVAIKERLSPIFNFKWRYIKGALKVALPSVPHYYSSYLLDNSDRAVMDITGAKVGAIGQYNVAYTIGGKLSTLGVALGIGFGPPLRKFLQKNDLENYRLYIVVAQTLFLLLTFSICIWMKEIFHIFIQNDALNTVYPLAIIIAMGYNYRPLYQATSIVLIDAENTPSLLKVSLGSGLLNILLNFIFIPLYGVEAAAYTTFFSLMYMGLSGFYIGTFKKRMTINFYPILWICGIITLTFVAYHMVELALIHKIIVSAVLTSIAGVLMLRLKQRSNQEFS